MHRIVSTVTTCLALAVVVAVLHVQNARAGDDDSPRPYLGVSLSDLGSGQRERLDLDPRVEGALVTDVRRDSPADEAGLRENDVILEVDGRPVSDTGEAIDALGSLRPGERITLKVNRGGLERTVTATLDEWPASLNPDGGARLGTGDAPRVWRLDGKGRGGVIVADEDGSIVIGDGDDVRLERRDGKVYVYRGDDEDPEVIVLDDDDDRVVIVDPKRDHRGGAWTMRDAPGVHVAPRIHAAPRIHFRGPAAEGGFLGVSSDGLEDGLRAYFGVDEDHGVLVTDVVEGSPAADAGLRPGDVILSVDGEPVSGPGDLRSAIRGIEPGREVDLRIVRDRSARTLPVRLGRSEDFSDADPGHLRFDDLDLHDLEVDLGEFLNHELPRLGEELRMNLRGLDDEDLEEFHRELRRGLEEMREGIRGTDLRLREAAREPDYDRNAA